MITNAILYRLDSAYPLSAAALEDRLQAAQFTPCGPTQEKAVGFVPPRGHEHGTLVEWVGSQLILKMVTETKSVPSAVISRHVAELLKLRLQKTGRKAGKKEIRDLKDDIRLELLPDAFPVQTATLILIDPVAKLLVIDATSQAKADDVVSFLISTVSDPTFSMHLLTTQVSPGAAMAVWLASGDEPEGFTVDRDCELKAQDESSAVVRYARCALDTEEVRDHVKAGMAPTRLALTWKDRVSFVLTDGLQIRKITFLEVVFSKDTEQAADDFDANVTISTGELRQLIPDLVAVLGGEVV
jgi:recombination associated protein RdgC